MNFLQSFLLLNLVALGVACGSAEEQDSNDVSILADSKDSRKLCERYSGRWISKDAKGTIVETIVLRGKTDRETGECSFTLEKDRETKLVLAMDGKPYDAIMHDTPVVVRSKWTDRVSVDDKKETKNSEKENINLVIEMKGKVAGTEYDMKTDAILKIDERGRLQLQSVAYSKITVNGEEDKSQPTERVDLIYTRGNWEE